MYLVKCLDKKVKSTWQRNNGDKLLFDGGRVVKTNTHCPIKTGDILLSDKRNTRFRVSSRAVFRGVVSLFFVVFIAHQKHGKHSANVFVLHSMQRARLDCYSRSYNGSYLSLFLFLFFLLPFLPFFFVQLSFQPEQEHWKLVVVSSIRANNKQLSRSLRMRLIKIAALTRRCSTIAVVGGYIIYAVPVERHNSWPVLHALYLARGTLLNRRLLPEKGSPNENPLCRIRLPTKWSRAYSENLARWNNYRGLWNVAMFTT